MRRQVQGRPQSGGIDVRIDIFFEAAVAHNGGGWHRDLGMAQSNVSQANSSKVINLTQVGCQFVESENGTNHGYSPAKKADCVEINGKTAEKTARCCQDAGTQIRRPYTFRVVNKNVPYELGFWLRSVGL